MYIIEKEKTYWLHVQKKTTLLQKPKNKKNSFCVKEKNFKQFGWLLVGQKKLGEKNEIT